MSFTCVQQHKLHLRIEVGAAPWQSWRYHQAACLLVVSGSNRWWWFVCFECCSWIALLRLGFKRCFKQMCFAHVEMKTNYVVQIIVSCLGSWSNVQIIACLHDHCSRQTSDFSLVMNYQHDCFFAENTRDMFVWFTDMFSQMLWCVCVEI